MKKFFRRFWKTWVWCGVAAEAVALAKGEEYTLSVNIRQWAGIHPPKKWAMFGAGVFVGFCGWLAVHITYGIMPWMENR